MSTWFRHVDLDQFQVSAELLRRPELRGRAVVVGGDGDPTRARQVVTCASYEARALGVRAGLPLRVAGRKAPDAVYLPLDLAYYEVVSGQVMDTLRATGGPVEVWGWDEAFLGADATDPEALARTVQSQVRDATGLPCSIGVGDNKLRAKVATGFGKPAGVYRLTAANWMAVMGDRPVRALWGVGARGAARFAEHGIRTVAELAGADPADLAVWWGPTTGPRYRALARGEGETSIRTEPWIARSRSHQTTYPEDLTTRPDIERELRVLAARVVADVVAEGRTITKVAVIVRSTAFFTESHVRTLAAATTAVGDVADAAVALLDRFELRRPTRLLGVRADLAPLPDPPGSPPTPVR
ncbi:DNA polymerase IV [Nakamurella sp.]|uniref:DNA polymerase IV n=1 Tax=Nakamurella sp. TaxID=1869182 RepID=UPI003B3B23AC